MNNYPPGFDESQLEGDPVFDNILDQVWAETEIQYMLYAMVDGEVVFKNTTALPEVLSMYVKNAEQAVEEKLADITEERIENKEVDCD